MWLLRRARRDERHRRAPTTDPTAAAPVARADTPPVVAPAALPAPDLPMLEAEARYHRDRLALYRARVLTAKPASPARLRELERISAAADARLRHAAKEHGPL
jgi:hypothetical protein